MKITIDDKVIQNKIKEYSLEYFDDFYIHDREELDEFLKAIDFLERNRKHNQWRDYGEFKFDDSKLEKNLHDARCFPILVLVEYIPDSDYHDPYTTFKLIDSTLGL